MSTRRIPGRHGWVGLAMLAAAVAVAAGAAGCGDVVREGTGSAFLVIDRLWAAPGGPSSAVGEFETVLRSDVRTLGSVYEDNGRVSLHLAAKDITTPLSSNNTVTITRYRVSYRRADGRNTPGVDVPYPFDGGFTVSVTAEGTVATFAIVRAQAKLEAPLAALANLGGAQIISTLADVTFYGTDQTGHDVSVTGTISINFADWADPETTAEPKSGS